MRLNHLIIVGAVGVAAFAGCSKSDNESLPTPPPPPAPKPGVELSTTDPKSSAQTPPGAIPPPDSGQLTAPAAATPRPKLAEDDLLGGNGRPLTEQEMILLNYGISMFQEEKGRLPTSLEEAVASRHISRIPKLPPDEEFHYDPQTGRVTVVKKGAAAAQ